MILIFWIFTIISFEMNIQSKSELSWVENSSQKCVVRYHGSQSFFFYGCHKQYMFQHSCAVWFLSFYLIRHQYFSREGFRQGFLWGLIFIYSPVYRCCALSKYNYNSTAWASDISSICIWGPQGQFHKQWVLFGADMPFYKLPRWI